MLKSDRDALVIVLIIALVAVILFPFLGKEQVTPSPASPMKGEEPRYARDAMRQPPLPLHGERVPERAGKGSFPFDPNTADSATLLRLGLRPWQVRNIMKYRAKGGRYRYKEDFARLYGLTLKDYRRLEPYIRIAPEVMAADVIHRPKTSSNSRPAPRDSRPSSEARPLPLHGGGGGRGISTLPLQGRAGGEASTQRQPSPPFKGGREGLGGRKGLLVDINTADTTLLKTIPGIGSYFARRIVELRTRRQAFLSPEELLDIRNFPEHTLAYMTASQDFPLVHINSATLPQLKAHPLINHTQASDILRYRRLNGAIRSVNDLSLVPSFTKAQLQRLAPFLRYE